MNNYRNLTRDDNDFCCWSTVIKIRLFKNFPSMADEVPHSSLDTIQIFSGDEHCSIILCSIITKHRYWNRYCCLLFIHTVELESNSLHASLFRFIFGIKWRYKRSKTTWKLKKRKEKKIYYKLWTFGREETLCDYHWHLQFEQEGEKRWV